MVAQPTNSGSSNNLTAKELKDMFLLADDLVYCDSTLTAKAGITSIKVKSGTCKPTAPKGRKLPLLLPGLPKNHKLPPTIILHDDDAVLEDVKDTQLEMCVREDESKVDDGEVDDTKEVGATEIASVFESQQDYSTKRPFDATLPCDCKEESYTGPGLIAANSQRWDVFLDMLE
ncbi:hypothetical protein DFH28DRAFT_1122059 [Melampsora americana]|nr:hypothetical protein DFH28DRAFT_1122059 [Melampsora americana]